MNLQNSFKIPNEYFFLLFPQKIDMDHCLQLQAIPTTITCRPPLATTLTQDQVVRADPAIVIDMLHPVIGVGSVNTWTIAGTMIDVHRLRLPETLKAFEMSLLSTLDLQPSTLSVSVSMRSTNAIKAILQLYIITITIFFPKKERKYPSCKSKRKTFIYSKI